ncbi:MAG TPA: hypothetical protein VLC28_10690 [Flavitalea sp.]|nr:hypothetical protein [Flavitalea sp.]
MGEAELVPKNHLLVIRSVIHFYGDASSQSLAELIARQISDHWNEPDPGVQLKTGFYKVRFEITGVHKPELRPEEVWYNDVPVNNYFRVEEYAHGNISFVDGLGSNTGYFKLENLLQTSTTAAHEYGHTLGLDHPVDTDLRGKGIPGIMYPRGTFCDSEMQYDPLAAAGSYGGFMNPVYRVVQRQDIVNLRLDRLHFDDAHRAVVGGFSSVYHDRHLQDV